MKPSARQNSKPSPGTGFLIGGVTGMAAAILVFIFTENIAIAIPVLAGLGLPLGIALEEKLQVGKGDRQPWSSKWAVFLLVIGILFFFFSLLAVKFT